ncbi:MAG: hypothetical protein GJT30_07810 [Geobacter sp.]|nr:hypothetical protein [Geobacter sp.]
MNKQILKLQSHTDHLLSCLLGLKEKFAFLRPMLFDEETVQQYGNGDRFRGFESIKYSLFYGCAQDLARMTLDTTERTPSIAGIIASLQANPHLLRELRIMYSEWGYGVPVNDSGDEEIKAALEQLHEREKEKRRQKFDAMCNELNTAWEAFKAKPSTKAFRIIRDRLTAHLELRRGEDGVYRPIDIATLGLTWGDLGESIRDVDKMVELLNAIVRNAGFVMEEFDEKLDEAVKGFWKTSSPAQ